MDHDGSDVLALRLLLFLQLGLFLYAIFVDGGPLSLTSRVVNTILKLSTTSCKSPKDDHGIPTLDFEWPNGQGTQKFFEGRASSIRWREQNGAIYQIWAGFKPEIVLASPEHLRSYFSDSDKHLKAPNNNSGWLIGEILGSCLGLVSGRRWANMRIAWEHPFSLPSARSYTILMTRSAREFVDSLHTSKGGTQDVFEVHITQTLKMYPFLVVAAILFGELSDDQRRALIGLAPLRERLWQEGITGGLNRTYLAKVFRTKGARMLDEFKAKWHSFIEDAYAESVKHGKNGAIEKLLEDAREGQHHTIEECMQTVDETLYANLDVTTSAVTWSHVLVAQHQAVQDDLQDEIRQHRNLSDDEWEAYINKSDTLLAFCVLEASRLRPILAFSNPESSPIDKVVGDIVIPRNTDVIVDSHAINIANSFWVNGFEFNPRRFEGLSPRQFRYHLYRFGFGPRKCLGQHVADRMIRAILAEMLSRYRLSVKSPTPDQESQIQDESWILLPDMVVECTSL